MPLEPPKTLLAVLRLEPLLLMLPLMLELLLLDSDTVSCNFNFHFLRPNVIQESVSQPKGADGETKGRGERKQLALSESTIITFGPLIGLKY